MEELRSSWMKLKRAKIHINALNRSIRRLLAANKDILLIHEEELKGFGKAKIYVVNPTTPVSWGLTVGDALTNLRASLDHIAWALALKVGTPKRPQSIQFPIFESADEYQRRARDMLKEIWPDARSVIESFQPYHSLERPQTDLLRVLNKLVNSDKHRVLTQTLVQIDVGGNPFEELVFRDRYKIILPPRVIERMEKNKRKPEPTIDVVFNAEGTPYDGYSVGCLNWIHDFIRDEVIPSFTCFFE